MSEKYVLILGDDEVRMLDYGKTLGILKDTCLNFENTPSIAVIYDVAVQDVKELIDDVRSHDMKAGVYSTLEKARGFMFKALALSEDGIMGEPQMITLGEVNS